MNKKPEFDLPIEKRILKAKKELETGNKPKNTSICVSIESTLLFSIKQVALNRKMQGKNPYTITGIITEAFKKICQEEL